VVTAFGTRLPVLVECPLLAGSGHPSPVTIVIEAKAATNTPSVGRHVGTDFETRRLHREARRRKTPPYTLVSRLCR
jgi:hypothetical protein